MPEDVLMKTKRRYVLALLFLFIILSSVHIFLSRGDASFGSFREQWFNCLTYVQQGTLYGGQPICVQGPVFLYVLYFLFKFIPFPIWHTLAWFNILVHVGIFALLLQLSRKNSMTAPLLVYFVGFAFLAFGYGNPAITLATLFFLAGIIVLHSHSAFKEILAGILFALVTLTQFTGASFVAVFIAAYLFEQWKQDKRKQDKNRTHILYKELLHLLLPLILLNLFAVFLFPHIFSYTILHGTRIETVPFGHLFYKIIIGDILKFNPFLLLVYGVLYGSVYLLWKEKNTLTMTLCIGMWLSWIILNRNHGEDIVRFLFPAFMLFPLLLFDYLAQKKVKYASLQGWIITLLFALPYFVLFVLTIQAASARLVAQQGLSFIPEQSGWIVTEGINPIRSREVMQEYYHYPLTQFDMAYLPIDVDPAHHGLFVLGVINGTENDWVLKVVGQAKEKNMHLVPDFKQGKYSLLIMREPPAFLDVIYKRDKEKAKQYCRVQVPFFGDSQKELRLLFAHEEDCILMDTQMKKYYADHLQQLCDESPSLAEEVKETMQKNNSTIALRCHSQTSWYERQQTVQSLAKDAQ